MHKISISAQKTQALFAEYFLKLLVMELSLVAAFAVVALALVVVPGPDWAYILTAGARDHVVVPAVGGILIGYAAVTAVVVAGVGALIAAAPTAMVVLTMAGAAYVTALGVQVLRAPTGYSVDGDAVAHRSRLGCLVRGAGVSASNPKGLLVFLAILPQFTRTSAAWPIWVQMGALAVVFIALCALVYLPLGHAARWLLGARPAIARHVTRLSGVAMVLLGAGLAAEQITHAIGA